MVFINANYLRRKNMSLRQKIGRMFMVGFDGTSPSEELIRLITKYNVAGVILFKRNIKSCDQLKKLTSEIQNIAGRKVLVAVDHEGGRVFRMPEPFTQWEPMAKIGEKMKSAGDENLPYRIGKKMAEELKDAGIDINFAPVLDVNTNIKNPVIGDRAFSEDAFFVAKAGVQLLRGLQDHGIVACGKHFPGHGDTFMDSHLDLPTLPHTIGRLESLELIPFAAAIEAGVKSIMTAHVIYEGIDEELPATLSMSIIKGLLINRLGFKGTVFTDDLMMKAITKKWTLAKAALMALKAGCHCLLICSNSLTQIETIEYLEKAALDGSLPESIIETAGRKIEGLAT